MAVNIDVEKIKRFLEEKSLAGSIRSRFDNIVIEGDLRSNPIQGQVGFNSNRQILEWYDGDNPEYPTFVDNQDTETSSKTVSNTTDEKEINRFSLDKGAFTKGRVFIIRTFGKYNTASSNDDFTYRVKVGPSGFDAVTGGKEIGKITTVQENVDDGPYQIKTTCTVFAEGSSGTLACHNEGAFNNNKKDSHVDPVTIDTTTAEEWASTVKWNNAKSGNSVTREQGYIQQQA